MAKIVNILEKKRWFTLDECTELLSKECPSISKADLLQFYLQGDLVLSIIVNSQLAKQRWEYCSLPNINDEKCIYTRIAQRYLRDQLTTTAEALFNFDNMVTGSQPKITLNSKDLFSELEVSNNNFQSKLLKKAEEVFQRWKYQGHPQIRHEYGNLTNLSGIFSIRIDSKIESCFLDYIIKGESNDVELDFIVLGFDDSAEYVLYADSQDAFRKTFSISDFILQKKHLIDFLTFIRDTESTSNKLLKVNKQAKREMLLVEYAKSNQLNGTANKNHIEVWNELSAIDKSLFPRRDNSDDSLVKAFFKKQAILNFKLGRPLGS